MAGSSYTSRPSGARRTTTRRSTQSRKPAGRRRPGSSRRKKKSRRKKGWNAARWWPALVVAAAVLVGLAWDTEKKGAPGVPGQCTIAGLSMTLTAEQVANAATIAAVGRDRGLPERAVVIALATAQQESRLRNLDYGDRDSLGLFQQRPSSGWGTPAEVQDPIYAAGKFYDHLVEVPGWETGRLTDVAQRVQRSAFPEAYEQWGEMAEKLAAAQVSELPDQITCVPDEAP
ncbi:MAG: hypothetical protein JWP62_2173 [Blastococcus sp.]|jgi:hypothetical protein|nr:hypothetical protein [Blastococcus sp.]